MSDLRIYLAGKIFSVGENLAGELAPSDGEMLADRDA